MHSYTFNNKKPPPSPSAQVHDFPPAQSFPPEDIEAKVFPPPQQQSFPQPNILLNQIQKNQQWKTHLFDCMKDPQNAIITLCCPCVTFGQIAEVVDNGSTSCASSGILYSLIACCFGVPCLLSCRYRSKLRAKFGLPESPAPDCLIHCFCDYCALCQEYRELYERGFDPSIGHAGIVARQQQQRLQQLGLIPPVHQNMTM